MLEGFPWRAFLAIVLAVSSPFATDLLSFSPLTGRRLVGYLLAMLIGLAALMLAWMEGSKRGFAPQFRSAARRARAAALEDAREAIRTLIHEPASVEAPPDPAEIRGLGRALQAVRDLQNFPAPEPSDSRLFVQQIRSSKH